MKKIIITIDPKKKISKAEKQEVITSVMSGFTDIEPKRVKVEFVKY